MNEAFPKGGVGGSDVWEKFPNNPVLFFEGFSYCTDMVPYHNKHDHIAEHAPTHIRKYTVHCLLVYCTRILVFHTRILVYLYTVLVY